MTDTLPNTAPTRAVAGDTIAWLLHVGNTRLSDGWTVTVYLTGPDTADVVAAADPDDTDSCIVTFAAGTTAALPPGGYRWTARASRGSGADLERRTLDSAHLQLLPDPAGLSGDEGLSTDERELRTVDALIARIQANPNASYTIEGVTATRHDLDSLYRRQGVLRARVTAARRGARGSRAIGRSIGVVLRRG